jgi:hypothetical protein
VPRRDPTDAFAHLLVRQAIARATFIEKLTEILAMRRAGKFDENIFDEYNEALVQLGDADLADMYQARGDAHALQHSSAAARMFCAQQASLPRPLSLSVVHAHLHGRGG